MMPAARATGVPIDFNKETRPNVNVYKGGLLSLLWLHISICCCPGRDRLQRDYCNKSRQEHDAALLVSLWPSPVFPRLITT